MFIAIESRSFDLKSELHHLSIIEHTQFLSVYSLFHVILWFIH